ncbi:MULTISPECIES: YdbL family protein [unclassified Ectothiorhodospira]|uniref:YdbL family protein n=1 Tax=unclassified Ectothiorhodospira TaxID=2684909 RepID=UPI001EE92DB1|nr:MULTISPECIES: YdbL family protein [unclassified Ectothiorhodospira]MCG5516744.1 YdbL family protein [Ectothiorhodospira sp. 9100]MCG5519184.1 YdbL family protein [Ectothiorhodospira sp. 9905]
MTPIARYAPPLAWFGLAFLLSACVTINIYFPAAAAEDAARIIVRDVLGEAEEQSPPAREDSGESRAPDQGALREMGGRVMVALVNGLISPAQAQQPDINIRSSAIDSLRASMRQRASALRPYFQSGAVGFTSDGRVAVRDLNAVPLRDRSSVQRLVAEENADRDALYREIARANDRPEWESDIRKTFARVWVEEAPSGYWYQDDRGRWQQK